MYVRTHIERKRVSSHNICYKLSTLPIALYPCIYELYAHAFMYVNAVCSHINVVFVLFLDVLLLSILYIELSFCRSQRKTIVMTSFSNLSGQYSGRLN